MRVLVPLCALLLLGWFVVQQIKANAPTFETADEAARYFLTRHNPDSVTRNVELGGYLYRNKNGRITSSKVIEGAHGNLYFPAATELVPESGEVIATWHTHGAAMPGVVSETFSPQDIKMNQKFGIDGYLATPSGQLKHYEPGNPDIRKLGALQTRN